MAVMTILFPAIYVGRKIKTNHSRVVWLSAAKTRRSSAVYFCITGGWIALFEWITLIEKKKSVFGCTACLKPTPETKNKEIRIKILTSFRLANKTLLGHRMNVKLQRGRWCSPPATEALGELAWETLRPRKCLIEYVARRESRGVHHSRVCYVASFMQTDSCWKWIGGKQNHLFNFLSPSLTHTLTHKEELSPLFHSGCLRLYELSLWWPVLPEDSV